jgi:hypothetical protein
MCLPKAAKKETPAVVTPEAPPPPEPTPEAPIIEEGSGRSDAGSREARRKGVSALRISLAVPGSGGKGVNVPT